MIATADIPPNQTLFCYNLNTKIHISDLKSLLFEFFSPYGKVLDVVASKKDPKKRGNAFVVLSELASATTALKSLQGKEFLGRPIGINYSKTKSDRVAMLEGTYKMRKRKTPAEQEEGRPTAEPASTQQPEKRIEHHPTAGSTTLFIENLPPVMTLAALIMLFKQYPGYQESRMVEGRGVAFVDFVNELQAEVAMRGLDGFLITTDHPMKISFAKK